MSWGLAGKNARHEFGGWVRYEKVEFVRLSEYGKTVTDAAIRRPVAEMDVAVIPCLYAGEDVKSRVLVMELRS